MKPARSVIGTAWFFLFIQATASGSPQLIEGLVNMRFQVSPQLFAVMSAVEASSGEGASLPAPADTVRIFLRSHLSAITPDLRERIVRFVAQDKAARPGSSWQSRYISLGIVMGPPPRFALPPKAADRPADVESLAGFESLVAELWNQCDLAGAWEKIRPLYVTEIENYRPLVRDMIVATLRYLHSEARIALDRNITMIPELLQPPGMVNARNLGHTYIVVVGPPRDGTPPIRSVRHEYLHFFIDPLLAKYVAYLPEPEPFLKRAAAQPAALPIYKQDFFLLVKESLIRMIEARLDFQSEEQRNSAVLASYDQGLILAPYFAGALRDFENSPESLPDSYQSMVEGIQWKNEDKRETELALMRAKTAARKVETLEPTEETDRSRFMLKEANERLAARDFDRASALLEDILARDPTNGNALFGLAQAAAQGGDAERALALYEKAAANAGSESWIAAWSLVRRGNIFEVLEETGRARAEWSRVLGLAGDLRGALEAAQKALSRTTP
jgi:hypothetical protein